VKAGESVGFAWGEPKSSIVERGAYHPGFAGIWMSKAGDGVDLAAYDGGGDWFKILQIVGRESQSVDFSLPENKRREDTHKSIWGTYLIESVSVHSFPPPHSQPSTHPPYSGTSQSQPPPHLLRWEHIFPNVYDAQYYVNCAHVQVINDGPVGTPGPLVKIPGVYTRGQKDVYFSSYDYGVPRNLTGFVPPKPEVWRG
jgi:hypothetical protein